MRTTPVILVRVLCVHLYVYLYLHLWHDHCVGGSLGPLEGHRLDLRNLRMFYADLNEDDMVLCVSDGARLSLS